MAWNVICVIIYNAMDQSGTASESASKLRSHECFAGGELCTWKRQTSCCDWCYWRLAALQKTTKETLVRSNARVSWHLKLITLGINSNQIEKVIGPNSDVVVGYNAVKEQNTVGNIYNNGTGNSCDKRAACRKRQWTDQ